VFEGSYGKKVHLGRHESGSKGWGGGQELYEGLWSEGPYVQAGENSGLPGEGSDEKRWKFSVPITIPGLHYGVYCEGPLKEKYPKRG